VKGLVAELINIKDPQATTALEVAAGGKLYQVVVKVFLPLDIGVGALRMH
jgi:chromosome segregation ATPase